MEKSFPQTDARTTQGYDRKTLDRKIGAKTALQAEIGWPAEPKRAIVCLPAGMTEELGGALLNETLPGILRLPMEILVLGKGSSSYGSMFTMLGKKHGHRIHIVPAREEGIAQMYAAADMALFTAEPGNLKELQRCLAYGVVPVAPETDRTVGTMLLEDYNPVQETGNAFLFAKPDPWHCFAALVRAVETYRFPYDWRTIQRHCLETAG